MAEETIEAVRQNFSDISIKKEEIDTQLSFTGWEEGEEEDTSLTDEEF